MHNDTTVLTSTELASYGMRPVPAIGQHDLRPLLLARLPNRTHDVPSAKPRRRKAVDCRVVSESKTPVSPDCHGRCVRHCANPSAVPLHFAGPGSWAGQPSLD